MNISGVVVRTFPRDIDTVTRALSEFDGVEVHGANEDGRLVVTVEQRDERGTADLLVRMQDVPGVLSASMIYHHFEDLGQQEAEQ
ncbi:MAG TPA: glutamate synthase [Gammaproteobacteria bacterium]|nr:glutamate synthase [Gammaproteobacteria bacterium]